MYIRKGKFEQAIEIIEESIIEIGRNPNLVAHIAIAQYKAGREKEFNSLIDELERRNAAKEKKVEMAFALLYAGIGEDKKALDWLEKAYLAKETRLVYLKIEPLFQHLHTYPEFKELLKKVGFE